MDVPEEESAQIAKRKAIQSIMRDTSLTPQEKQKKIQQFMASGGASAPPPAPSKAAPPPPAPAPPAASTSNAGGGRQAIQAIMRDTSLTPQERQRRVQEAMARSGPGGPSGGSAPTPAPPAPAPAPTPQSSASGGGGGGGGNRQAIQAVMRDTSLTPQERQKKVQELMASSGPGGPSSGTAPQPELSPPPAPSPAPPASTAAPATSKQALMQAVMRDTSLTPQEKQKKIQEIMAGGSPAEANAPRPSSALMQPPGSTPQSAAAPPPPAQNQPQISESRKAMQAVMQDPSLTPQEKQRRIQAIMASGSSVPPSAPQSAETANASVTPGAATMGMGEDPAARKAGRPSRPPGSMASVPLDSQSVGSVPSQAASVRSDDPAARKVARDSARSAASSRTAGSGAMPPPSTTARSDDPAARKMARDSARYTAPAGAAPPAASVASPPSSARSEDPAARKVARDSARTGRSANRAAAAQRSTMNQQQSIGSVAPPNDMGYASRPNPGYSEPDARAKAEREPSFASPPTSIVPEPQPDYGFENSSAPPPTVVPSIQQYLDDEDETQPVATNESAPRSPEAPTPQNYEIPGADSGGIQAYVAGQQQVDESAVVATGVVTEAEIEEEDRRKQTQYLWRGACLFCCLVIIIVVVVVLTIEDPEPPEDIGNITDSPTEAPSMAPTSNNFLQLLNILRIKYGSDDAFDAVFGNETTPQYRAAMWAADEAPIGLAGNDPRMLSRYSLATFYFATNGDDWVRCGRQSTNCDEGREWLTAESECDWDSVTCDDDFTVVDIFFRPVAFTGNNMVGTLPLDISFLSGLQRMILSREMLSGTIPPELTDLSALTSLLLPSNEFTGSFPAFLINENPLLASIYFSGNRLTGGLPSLLSSSVLKDLRISENSLTGPIPASISALSSLSTLHLDNNDFSGMIPEELYSLSGLRSIRLSNNTALTGTLPESISQLTALLQLGLVNTNVGGTLPSGLFELEKLSSLEISQGNFTGTLSESFGSLAELGILRLNNNTFTGTIPDAAFASLQFLEELSLHYNDLTGAVSEALCNRTGDNFFDIKFLSADCAGEPPQLSCDCCTCF